MFEERWKMQLPIRQERLQNIFFLCVDSFESFGNFGALEPVSDQWVYLQSAVGDHFDDLL
jgi:hypothetical protein